MPRRLAIASIGGPVVGGLITEHWHWRAIFWLNLPLGALALAMTWNTLKRLKWQRRDHRLDFLGAAMIVSATVSLMLALTWGGADGRWTSPTVLGLLAGAAVLLILLARHLTRASEPLIPLRVLGNPVVLAATLAVFFSMAGYVGLRSSVPLYLQLVLGLSASQAGLALVTYLAGTVLGANMAALDGARVQRYKRLPVAGASRRSPLPASRSPRPISVCLRRSASSSSSAIFAYRTQFPVTTVSVQNAVSPADIGVATARSGRSVQRASAS
ncbi:MAG: MFS transporter [Hyphomicrobiaceae bacterium]